MARRVRPEGSVFDRMYARGRPLAGVVDNGAAEKRERDIQACERLLILLRRKHPERAAVEE